MTATASAPAVSAARSRPEVGPALALRCVGLIVVRDVLVGVRQLPVFLAQTTLQPFFVLFVFGRLLASLGLTQPGYPAILLPGIVALQGLLVSVQDTAVPLVAEFSETREIEDRLLAPIPGWLVGAEKVLLGVVRGTVAALIATVLGLLVLPEVRWPVSVLPGVLGVLLLGCVVGAGIGMIIGTTVSGEQISIVLTVVALPLMFTGSTSFPWLGLAAMPWFQVVCALNPLTFLSEGLRALVVPGLRSLPLGVDLGVLAPTAVVAVLLGLRCFVRRAVA